LIASFKATLEETRQADLLMHVADASNPRVIDQIISVYEVLKEIGIEEKDAILVLNKIDAALEMPHYNSLLERYSNAVAVSAKTGEGFDKLHKVVGDALSRSFQDVDVEMSVSNGRLLAYLAAKGEIKSTQYREDAILVHCRIPQKYLGRIDYDDAIITPHNAAGWVTAEEKEANAESETETASAPTEESLLEEPAVEVPEYEAFVDPVEAPQD